MAFSHSRRIERWLRTADIVLVLAWFAVSYLCFPITFQRTLAWVMAVAWYAGVVTVGGQNAAYLHPRYRIFYSMALSLAFSTLCGIFWMGNGHDWYLKGGVHTLLALALAGTLERFLIAAIIQRPALQLVPCRLPEEYHSLLEEMAAHPQVYVEPMLMNPADLLPERRAGYPIYQIVTDLRLGQSDYDAMLPLYEQVEIIDICELYESLFGKVAITRENGEWKLPRALRVPSPIREVISRTFDVLFVILTSPIILLVVGVAALAIKLTSRGPVLFRQERLGRYGKRFRIVKLRTMRTDAEMNGRQWSAAGDARVTPVGRLLRATAIDELPQFWNILQGDMRLVGPRPEVPDIAERLAQTIPFYHARLLVAPGLGGWAQLHQGGDATEEDVLNKIRYDLFYLKYGTPLMDLRILLGTVQMLLHLAKPKPKSKQKAGTQPVTEKA